MHPPRDGSEDLLAYAQRIRVTVRERLTKQREHAAVVIQRTLRAWWARRECAEPPCAEPIPARGGLRDQLLRDRREFEELRGRAERLAKERQEEGEAMHQLDQEVATEGFVLVPPESQLSGAQSWIAQLEHQLAREQQARAAAEDEVARLESNEEQLRRALDAAADEIERQGVQADEELGELRELLLESGNISSQLENSCRSLQQQTQYWQQKAEEAMLPSGVSDVEDRLAAQRKEVLAAKAALEQEQTARFALEEQLAAQCTEGRLLEELEAARLEINVLHTRLENFHSQMRLDDSQETSRLQSGEELLADFFEP